MTVAQTTRASVAALDPGDSLLDPCTPRIFRQAACGGRTVPPPIVPTSMEGIVQLMKRSSPFSPVGSSTVIQLELHTVWAGSCPVAMKTAATMLAAWALNPPMLPAIAEPIRFLLVLRSTTAWTDVFSRDFTTVLGTTASHTTDLPRPSSQLTADGFLSVQKFPLRLMISMSLKNSSCSIESAFSDPFDNMFMPIASPVTATNLMYRFLATCTTCNFFNLANLLVLLKLSATRS